MFFQVAGGSRPTDGQGQRATPCPPSVGPSRREGEKKDGEGRGEAMKDEGKKQCWNEGRMEMQERREKERSERGEVGNTGRKEGSRQRIERGGNETFVVRLVGWGQPQPP